MKHADVSSRQRAGTLERVVKYDQEAFSEVWDYLASSSSDADDKFNFKNFFFFGTFPPLEIVRKIAFFGPTDFLGRSPMLGNARKKRGFN